MKALLPAHRAGEVLAWGINDFGQLGNGSTFYETSPTKVGASPILALHLTSTSCSCMPSLMCRIGHCRAGTGHLLLRPAIQAADLAGHGCRA